MSKRSNLKYHTLETLILQNNGDSTVSDSIIVKICTVKH